MKRHLACLSLLGATLALLTPFGQTRAAADTLRSTSSGLRDSAMSERFIVTYRRDSTEFHNPQAVVQNVIAAVGRANLDRAFVGHGQGSHAAPLSTHYVRKLAVGGDLIRVSRPLDDGQARSLMRAIATDPAVLHVERDLRMRALRDVSFSRLAMPSAATPNDPLYATHQWHYKGPPGGAHIDQAWELADGKNATIAVLDTGITRHPDLDTSLADAGYDFITDAFVSGRESDGRVPGGWDPGDWDNEPRYASCQESPGGDSSSWHGTHVTGTVAALTDNRLGGAGIAHKAKVLPVRVLGHCGGDVSDIVDAIVWAAGGHVDGVPDNAQPAQVINMSMGAAISGGCTQTPSFQRAIAEANRRGVIVVAAAGNSAADVSSEVPASCPGAIAVAANDSAGGQAFYSNTGSGIALAAPGGDEAEEGDPTGSVWSTVNLGARGPAEPGYAGHIGTSMAAPHVAGAAALIISAVMQAGLPSLTPGQLQKLLVETARPFPIMPDQPIGSGILDARAAVVRAVSGEELPVIILRRGVLMSDQAIAEGEGLLYAIEVPPGVRYLNLRTLGGTGDAALYVKTTVPPAANGADADASSDKPGNNEAVVMARPQPGTWYLRVRARQAVGKLAVLGNYTL